MDGELRRGSYKLGALAFRDNSIDIASFIQIHGSGNTTHSETMVGFAEAMAIVMTTLGICILLGNGLVIVSYFRFEWLRSNTSMCIVSMAIADLLIGVSAVPLHLGLGIFKLGIHKSFCQAIYTIDPALCQVSILHILLVNVDRYVAISRPLSYPRIMTKEKICVGILLAWILGTLVAIGPALNIYHYDQLCDVYVSPATATVCAVILFWLPFLVICIIYAKIVRIANSNLSRASRVSGTTATSEPVAQSARKIQQNVGITQSTRKTLRTIACVIGGFGICWGPYFIMFSVSALLGQSTSVVLLGQIFSVLAYTNSLLNPAIYGYLNADFRRAFRKLLCFQSEVAPSATRLPTLSALVCSGGRSFRANHIVTSE